MAAHANEGPSPDAAHLGLKISALNVNWVSFEDGYQNLYGTVTADQDIKKVKVMFERQLAFFLSFFLYCQSAQSISDFLAN